MGIKFIAWGKWGSDVSLILKQLKPEISAQISNCTEADFGFPHMPDPVIADHFFYNLSTNLLKRHIDPHSDYHLHILHAADNFASGAVTGLMHRLNSSERKQTHIALILLPPRGSNSATVGRLLANITGLRKFFDICVFIDSVAPAFLDWDSEHLVYYVAGLADMFHVFEQSACMLPLLEHLDSRFLSFAIAPNSAVLAECSLIPLWQEMTTPLNTRAQTLTTTKILAFSVSEKPEKNIYQLFRRNLPRDSFFYIPFLRAHDWKNLRNPKNLVAGKNGTIGIMRPELNFDNMFSSLGQIFGKRSENFTAAFASNIPHKALVYFLLRYVEKYWPEGKNNDKYEYFEPETLDWCRAVQISSPVSRQHKYLAKSAFSFIKEKFSLSTAR